MKRTEEAQEQKKRERKAGLDNDNMLSHNCQHHPSQYSVSYHVMFFSIKKVGKGEGLWICALSLINVFLAPVRTLCFY